MSNFEELRKCSFGLIGFAWDVADFVGKRPVCDKDFEGALSKLSEFREHLCKARPSSAEAFNAMSDTEFTEFLRYSWDQCL